ncbi:hypothetical protein GE061_017830 [Apolygus lucorum]|uniref:Uncharacterized protein n=1 Tax=Apolygus lucorum TaxID=248454 RepID=A0A6A4J343_APOLU|nr:hypothetical protein GE061_017830 [Apolygus lucorum]
MLELSDVLESQEDGCTLPELIQNVLSKCDGNPRITMPRIMDALLTAEKLELVERIDSSKKSDSFHDEPKPSTQAEKKRSVSSATCLSKHKMKRKRSNASSRKKRLRRDSVERQPGIKIKTDSNES